MGLHPVLLASLERLRARFEADERCIGMYLWGSTGNDTADDWSDIDVAAVFRDGDYEAIKAEIQSICTADCGRIVLWLPECEARETVNDAFLFQVEDRLHLYDFTIMSAGHLERTVSLRPHKIVFDKTGALRQAASRETRQQVTLDPGDLLHQIRNYWVYSYLNGKYYKRGDVYKLLYVQGVLFQTHLKVLQFSRPEIEWTWWARDAHSLPRALQDELLVYFGAVQPDAIASALKTEFALFSRDARTACAQWNLHYPEHIEAAVRGHLNFMGVLR